nr:uncharacterized protein LOC107442545 [Parasteatoda tepidariorum]
MTSCVPMAQLQQNYKTRETTKSQMKERKRNQLITLLKDADRYVEELASFVLRAASSGRLSVDLGKEKEKHLSTRSKKKELIWKMKSEWDKLKIPDKPSAVSIDIVGTKSLKVKFSPSISSREPDANVTKYKVNRPLMQQ